MEPVGGKKALIVAIQKILAYYSDHEHPLSTKEIIRLVKDKYGIASERKAITRNISLLCEMGYDIHLHGEDNKAGYYLRERDFDDAEIRLLIDSVLSSRYIPEKDANRLIRKLHGLSNIYFSNKMKHIHSSQEWPHVRNKQLFFNIDQIDEAIQKRKQIEFTYNAYAPDGTIHPRRDRTYILNPYHMVCSNEQYYLIGNYYKYDDITHYRLDLITDIKILDSAARPVRDLPGFKSGLNIGRYVSQHIYMFGGEPKEVILRMDSSMVGAVVSKFGDKASIKPIDDSAIKVRVTTAPEGIKFWILQCGSRCRVIRPEALKSWMQNELQEMELSYFVS